jgi:hypothetical protein
MKYLKTLMQNIIFHIFSIVILLDLCRLGSAQKVPSEDSILATVYDDALSTQTIHDLYESCLEVEKYSASNAAMNKFNKRSTYWTARSKIYKPAHAIDDAIKNLLQLLKNEMLTSGTTDRVAGAEWWVQIRKEKEDISFHYDKDESVASNQMIMKFPLASTVTYITETGGPTLVLNMTTPDGNCKFPFSIKLVNL